MMWWANPLDKLLKRVSGRRVLVVWNRGLGDIPLGLVALVHRIRSYIKDPEIFFLTRSDLAEGFAFIPGVFVLVAPHWVRGGSIDLEETLASLGHALADFDCILERPDPTRHLRWQIGSFIPKLQWQERFEVAPEAYGLDVNLRYIGVHVHSETVYSYEKNWPEERWQGLFSRLPEGSQVLLFGMQPKSSFSMPRVHDLRGKTSLCAVLSLIKNVCSALVVPDSGLLAFTYYLDLSFPLKIVSLWADPRQGVLRQAVESPNPQLVHVPLFGKKEQIATISEEMVLEALL